jgi:hypothetical protein
MPIAIVIVKGRTLTLLPVHYRVAAFKPAGGRVAGLNPLAGRRGLCGVIFSWRGISCILKYKRVAMLYVKKSFFLVVLLMVGAVLVSADEKVVGRLITASVSGVDTTKLYEPLVNIEQSSILGIQNFTLRLTGKRARDSKQYEFYNESSGDGEGSAANAGDTVIWKRRARNVTVRPLNAYITVSPGKGNTNVIVINYEYRGRKGFGNVVYVIAVEK